MPKEKNYNPAAAQRKADKQREIARGKKQVQAQRNEKLARRNPDRLQRQIDELKALEERGALRPKDRETLAQLEKDLRGVQRARAALGDKDALSGDKAPPPRTQGRGDPRQEQIDRRQHLGKRRRDDGDVHAESDDGLPDVVDPDVVKIPMPRDTPPPFPDGPSTTARAERGHRAPAVEPAAVPSKKVYSSAPQMRDLKKEAVRFMPAAVAAQQNRIKGQGRLLEPEEADRLEQAGYRAAKQAAEAADQEAKHTRAEHVASTEASAVDLDEETRKLEKEISDIYSDDVATHEGNSNRAHLRVVMEEVDDDGAP